MKLIIWDLDDTLWHGTVYFGDTVKLKEETKEVLKQLDKMGIVQYVCSHNKLEDAVRQIHAFNLQKYFTGIYSEIERKKYEMVSEIMEREKLSPEETLFIDDQMLNRESVKQACGCHVDYEEDLYRVLKYFDTDRLKIMNQQRNRTGAENTWTGNWQDFLKTINMEFTIKKADETEISRIADLANRTNELNAIRNRYTEKQIKELMSDKNYTIYVAYLRDKFGDYGLIGETIIDKTKHPKEWFVKDICISCRTMGRGVGGRLLEHVVDEGRAEGLEKIVGHIIPTTENYRMKPLFTNRGFKYVKSDNGTEVYEWKKDDDYDLKEIEKNDLN